MSSKRTWLRATATLWLLLLSGASERTAAERIGLLGLISNDLRLTASEEAALQGGRVVVKIADSGAPSQIVVFAGSRIHVTTAQFVSALRHSPTLWKGPHVPRTGRFSTPSRLEDTADMQLPPGDTDALRRCRAGDCAVKLSHEEIRRVLVAAEQGPRRWRAVVHDEFRLMVVQRINAYRQRGLGALAPYFDHEEPIDPKLVFGSLFESSHIVSASVRRLAEYLAAYPSSGLPPGAEEHFYWLQTVHTPKSTIQVWHSVLWPSPDEELVEAVAVSRQIFATHYINGALAVTALVRVDSGDPYMLYINRSSADGMAGAFAGLKRLFIERRVRTGARETFGHLTDRIVKWPSCVGNIWSEPRPDLPNVATDETS